MVDENSEETVKSINKRVEHMVEDEIAFKKRITEKKKNSMKIDSNRFNTHSLATSFSFICVFIILIFLTFMLKGMKNKIDSIEKKIDAIYLNIEKTK